MRSKGKWLSSLALAIVSAPSTTALHCTQYFPFTTFPHDEQNKGIVDIFLWYIYLLHCRRNKLVRIIQFQVIFMVGVELFSAKLFLPFFDFLLFSLKLLHLSTQFITSSYDTYLLFYHTCCPPFLPLINCISQLKVILWALPVRYKTYCNIAFWSVKVILHDQKTLKIKLFTLMIKKYRFETKKNS